MSVRFVEVVFEEGESLGLGLEKHKLAYSVDSGRMTTVDCCIVTYSSISAEVKEGDILVAVNEEPLINNPFPPPGHFESCVRSLALAKKVTSTIRFLRTTGAAESLKKQSDLTIIELTPREASMIYYEIREKELNDKNKKKEIDRIQAMERENERKRYLFDLKERLKHEEEAKALEEETRKLEERAAVIFAERERKLAEDQEKLRFELVPSQVYVYQHLFHGYDSLGLSIVPRQIRVVLSSGTKAVMDCCVVTDSASSPNILPGDIISKINGQSITMSSRSDDGVATDFLGRSLQIISSASAPRMLEFMRPSGSTYILPAGLNPYLILRLTSSDEVAIFGYGDYSMSASRAPASAPAPYVHDPKFVTDQSLQNPAFEAEIERRIIARMREKERIAGAVLSELNDNENLTEEEEITRRVAIEAQKFLHEEMTRLEADRLEKLALSVAAEQADIQAQRLLIADEIKRADEHTRKSFAEAEARELQTRQTGDAIRRFLEKEVREKVDHEMGKVQEEKAKKLADLEKQIELTGELLAKEAAERAVLEKEAEKKRIIAESENRKAYEMMEAARKMDYEVQKRFAAEAKRITEEKRTEYLQQLQSMESKLVQEEMVKKAAEDEARAKVAAQKQAEEAEKKRQRQLADQAAFNLANDRVPVTGSVYTTTFPGPHTIGLEVAPHNVIYTDMTGKLQTIDCCMVVGSTLTDDVHSGDILMSVNNIPVIASRSNTFDIISPQYFESSKSVISSAQFPRTVRYLRLPAASCAAGSLSMNASLSDALLLLSSAE